MQHQEQGPKHIAIAGNIGAGKTTLTKLLSKNLGWHPHFEDVDDNPYLYDFYNDMPRWSFNLQIYFLNKRLQQLLEIQKMGVTVVQDRTIYEDAKIFAPNLHAMGLRTSRDFNNYSNLFDNFKQLIAPPDLIVYLKASIPTLVNHIQERGREYEDSLRLDYLRRLNECYEDWAKQHSESNLLIIPIDNLDFKNDPEALSEIIERINSTLYGFF